MIKDFKIQTPDGSVFVLKGQFVGLETVHWVRHLPFMHIVDLGLIPSNTSHMVS